MEYTSLTSTSCKVIFFFSITIFGVEGTINNEVFGLEPSFDVPVINVTVREGDTAVLPCSVDNLGDKKVVWTDKWATLLTLEFLRIIDDTRISIERPFTRDWNLHIRKVTYNDRGEYTCQINTNPIKLKKVMLIVQVPSKIINEYSSVDQTVREGATVTLVCNVTGVPMPDVTWYKQPNEGAVAKERLHLEPGKQTFIGSCAYTLKQTEIGTSGEVLVIHNVSRYCDGAYECVAYNGIDPAVTRQIKVNVEFPPEVQLNAKRMGQYVGYETILDCEILAYPHGLMYWKFDGKEITQKMSEKYSLEIYGGKDDSKSKTLSLRIRDIQAEDYGSYVCFAKNSIGQDSQTMVLYDYSVLEKKPESTTPFMQTTRQPIIFGGTGSEFSNHYTPKTHLTGKPIGPPTFGETNDQYMTGGYNANNFAMPTSSKTSSVLCISLMTSCMTMYYFSL